MLAGVVLAACLNGPFYPPRWDGPPCAAARQALECTCSECFKWDLPVDLSKVDGWQVGRRVKGGTDPAWRIVGYVGCVAAFVDEDGNFWPRGCRNQWCPGLDTSTLPVRGAVYEYVVRGVRGLEVGKWATTPLTYVGAPLDCNVGGGWVACWPGDVVREVGP